ncbi:MAG: Gfo/Idh/MocA family oxidoreductase [Nanoarchaeota archaeon]
MTNPIKLLQISCTSEWVQSRVFPTLFNDNRFSLENTVEIIRDTGHLQELLSESEIGKTLWQKISSGETHYFPISAMSGNGLPEQAYKNVDALVIHSLNGSHFYYIEKAIMNGKDVICEKPLVPLMDSMGNADRSELDTLVELTMLGDKKELIMMDAEHYSAKKISRILFDRIDELVEKYGKITNVIGELKEKDNPSNPRTQRILSLDNRTGLLEDTGVHLLSFITNLGSRVETVSEVCYDAYQNYDVETYASVKVSLAPAKLFSDSAEFNFTLAKFVNLMKEPQPESKYLEFTLKKGTAETKLRVDFLEQRIYLIGANDFKEEVTSKTEHSDLEYVNILNDFYQAYTTGVSPRTNFSKSIITLEGLYKIRSYRDKEKVNVYA